MAVPRPLQGGLQWGEIFGCIALTVPEGSLVCERGPICMYGNGGVIWRSMYGKGGGVKQKL